MFFLVREIKGVDDLEVGTIFPLKAVTAEGRPHVIPEITLSRGTNRFLFRPGQPALILLKGEFWHKNFWSIDLETSQQRQLTSFNHPLFSNPNSSSCPGPCILEPSRALQTTIDRFSLV